MKKGGRLLTIYALVYFVFLYAPALLLPIFALNDSKVISFPLSGFTTSWFTGLVTDPKLATLKSSLWTSLQVALTTSILATTLGIFAARAASKYRFAGKGAAISFIMLPLVLPEVVIGASLLVVLVVWLQVPLGTFAVILGHVLICTPFAIAILQGAFASLDQSLEEAAYDLGETPASAFWRVILPLVMPGIISSLLITFIISLDEFMIAYFLASNNPTLPVYLWGMLRFPDRVPYVMALGTILVLLSIFLLTIAEYFRRRGIAKSGGKDTGGFL